MNNIGKYISYKEATRSQTATRLQIDNMPNGEHLANMKILYDKVFEPLRMWYGKPIRISSFFRSQELNKSIGGSSNSQHCSGMAIDLDTEKDNSKLFNYILNYLDFDQLIYEFGDAINPAWVHVSYNHKGNRKQVLKAVKNNGRTQYIEL